MIESETGPPGLDAVVDAYMRCRRLLGGDAPLPEEEGPDWAAHDAFEDAVRRAPAAQAWALVVRLLDRSPDEELDVHAAGALEDLVARRGAELVDRIEAEAARDPRFRWALGCVWLSHGQLPPDVLDRVVAASGGEIKPLPPLEDLPPLDLPPL